MSGIRTGKDAAAGTELYERPQGTGIVRAVGEGILWLRIPLPFAPRVVNAYALRDARGWALIDTGAHHPDAFDCWNGIIDQLAPEGGITRIIGTHAHPDHIGAAGWLVQRTGAPFLTSQVEYLLGNLHAHETPPERLDRNRAYFRACGVSPAEMAALEDGDPAFGFIAPMPTRFTRLRAGDEITIGTRCWQVLMGSGHAPEHVTLYSPADRILLAGDQFLPKIVPIVNTYPHEPEADPIRDYLDSLAAYRQLPADTVVLPGHGIPFSGITRRIEAAGHGFAADLDGLLRLVRAGGSVREFVQASGVRQDSTETLRMAISRATAQLCRLMAEGRVRRSVSADGCWRFGTR